MSSLCNSKYQYEVIEAAIIAEIIVEIILIVVMFFFIIHFNM